MESRRRVRATGRATGGPTLAVLGPHDFLERSRCGTSARVGIRAR
ncbi:hypothetical protein OHB00_07500 [Streptomyces sp. NBC_00631]